MNYATKDNGFWVIPTYDRPQNIRNLFAIFAETSVTTKGKVIMGVGAWENHKDQFLKMRLPPGWSFEVFADPGSLKSNMRNITDTLDYRDAKWVGVFFDDMVPLTEQWDAKTIAHLNGKNFVSGTDNWHPRGPETLVGALAFSMPILTAIGSLYPHDCRHMYWDNVMELIGKDCDCWVIDNSIEVEHNHYLNGKALRDHSYLTSDDCFDKDTILWRKWVLEKSFNTKARVNKLLKGDI